MGSSCVTANAAFHVSFDGAGAALSVRTICTAQYGPATPGDRIEDVSLTKSKIIPLYERGRLF
jgi:hypothetical protein